MSDIGVGYTWEKGGRLYKVVYRLLGVGDYYVVVMQGQGDRTEEIVAVAPDDMNFWCAAEIREESDGAG